MDSLNEETDSKRQPTISLLPYRNGCGSSLIHSDILLSAAHCNQVVFGVTLSGAYTVNRTVFIGSTIRDGRDAAEAIPVQHFVQHPSKFSSIHPLE